MTVKRSVNSSEETTQSPAPVEFLILGAGWTSTFLIPLLDSHSISHAETSTTGRDSTIEFRFDPTSDSPEPYRRLPSAQTILITFPLTGAGASRLLTRLYRGVHGPSNRWIQLGSTSIFAAPRWNSSRSPYDTAHPRAVAEDELRAAVQGCVLNLAGLYGGARDPVDWVMRVAPTKDALRAKKALHLIHGVDVARAVLALHRHFTPAARWLLADLHVYDWWDRVMAWAPEVRERAAATLGKEQAGKLEFEKWVCELMEEEGVRALPRGAEELGRVLDSRDFWREMALWPEKARLS